MFLCKNYFLHQSSVFVLQERKTRYIFVQIKTRKNAKNVFNFLGILLPFL